MTSKITGGALSKFSPDHQSPRAGANDIPLIDQHLSVGDDLGDETNPLVKFGVDMS